MSVFDVLSYPKLYHNLKAAVKEVCTEADNPDIFYDDCAIPGREMLEIIRNREFSRLPGTMSGTAAEALDQLLHTRDGQLCDIIVDKAALEAIYEAGNGPGKRLLQIMRIRLWRSQTSRSPCGLGKQGKAQILCTAPWPGAAV